MQKFLLIIVLSTCACFTQAQVWTNFINGIPNIGAPDIYCAVEDTNNHILYLSGGRFAAINQYTTNSIIKFDGVNFDTLQSGIDDDFPYNFYSQVRNMVMYKNKLYVFGRFDKAGHTYTQNMGVWNGASWDPIKAVGFPDFAYILNDDMYIWGLDSIEGMKINGMGRFDGTNWSDFSVPHTAGHTADYIVNFQGKLYKSGQVTSASSDANLSYSDGTNWIPWVGVSGDNNKGVHGMKVIDSLLFVYGRFNSIAGTNCKGLAAYNGKNWYGLGKGLDASNWQTIENIQKINGELYITGTFDKIEDVGNSVFPQSTNLAKFDGEKWCIISPPFNNVVLGVVNYKNDLYVYGGFEKIGPDTIRGFGKYNGGFNEICSQNVTINMSVTGLNEIIDFGSLKIYPNPTSDKLNIEFTDIKISTVKIHLLNSIGQVVYSIEQPEIKQEIDLRLFSNGIYFLKLQSNSEQKVIKIIKEE